LILQQPSARNSNSSRIGFIGVGTDDFTVIIRYIEAMAGVTVAGRGSRRRSRSAG